MIKYPLINRTIMKTRTTPTAAPAANGAPIQHQNMKFGQKFAAIGSRMLKLTMLMLCGLGYSIGLFAGSNPLSLNKIDARLFPQGGTGMSVIDANVTVFDNSFSNGIDPYDAMKMTNPGENFALKRNGYTLVIEARQQFAERDTVFFEMWSMQVRNYTLELLPRFTGMIGLSVVLKDNYTGSLTPVLINDTTRYNFSCDANVASRANDRFRLLLNNPLGSLPVRFVSIMAEDKGSEVAVSWNVAQEMGVDHYEVERSADGKNFSTIARVSGGMAGARGYTYRYSDQSAISGTLFYRIRNVDFSGTSQLSAIVRAARSNRASGIGVYPNPVRGGQLNIQLNHFKAGTVHIQVTDLNGRSVYTNRQELAGGSVLLQEQLPVRLAAGSYWLMVQEEGGERHSLQLQVL